MRLPSKDILIIFFFSFLLSLSPLILRWHVYGMPGIIGSYYHQRITGYMADGSFDWYDPLSFGGRPYTYPPFFSFIHAGFAIAFGLEAGGALMMGIFGGLTSVICFLISKELIGERKKPLIRKALLPAFLVFSPTFIYLFSHLCTRSPPILFGLLAVYLVLKKKPWWWVSVALASSLIFHPETGMLFSALAFICDKRYYKNARFIGLAALLSSIFFIPFCLAFGFPEFNAIHEDYARRAYGLESFNLPFLTWETGTSYESAVNLAVLFLSFVGLYWTKNRFLRIWFLLCLGLGLASTRLLIYFAFPAAILAAAGAYRISDKYKKYGNLLMASFLAYSIIIGSWYISSFAGTWPTKSETEAMFWIRGNIPENATILSDWAQAHWITGIAYRKSFIDGYAEYAPQANERMSQLKEFYRTCKVPEGYGIEYAFFEDWFIRWKENVTCLDRFQKVYDRDYIYVYKLA